MSGRFIDAVKNHQDLKHQIDAWAFLQATVHKEVLDEFFRRFRNERNIISSSNIPKAALDIIKEFEGCHLDVYPDPKTKKEPYTVGWGSTRKRDGSSFRMGERITQKEADDLLMFDIEKRFLPVLEKSIPYWNEMNENQKSALISFGYNLGANFYGSSGFATLSRVLKEKKWNEIPKTLELYRNPGTRVETGLLRRRRAEGRLWIS